MRHHGHLLLLLATVLATAWTPNAQAAEGATPPPPQELTTPEIIENPEVTLLDSEGAGKLYRVGEHLVCVMEGTPEEMGYQHGRLLAKPIHHVMKEGYVKKALWDKGYTWDYAMAQSERMEKHFPPEYVAEMNGVVKGLRAAGIDDLNYEDIRLAVTEAEILHYGPGEAPECSNFACWGKWTPDGRLLHGRNLDWNISDDAQDDAALFVWRPKGGIPFMMVGWAGGIGSVSGMNAQGITMGEMTLPSPDVTFDGLPLFLIMRRVLEKATNLDEAVAIMDKGPRTTGWNFIIGDAKVPDGRALEVDGTYCTVFTPMDPKENEETGHWGMQDAVRRTNHPVGMPQLMRLAKTFGGDMGLSVETEEDVAKLVPFLRLQDTWQRYNFMSKQIEARAGAVDVPAALQILSNGPVLCDVTLHSWVFDPKNQSAYVANAGNNPPVTATKRPYTRIDLKAWFQ